MNSVFILRRHIVDGRRTQSSIETTRDLRVAGVADSLFKARPMLAACDPDVLIADLRLEDGTLLGLLHEMRTAHPTGERPRVLLVVPMADDPMLFGALRSGGDSWVVEQEASSAPTAALYRVLRGEAAGCATVARQALSFFGIPFVASDMPSAQERTLDWQSDANNPLRLSRAEQRMLVLLALGHGAGQVALRMGVSIEGIGRRLGNVIRKVQWDLKSGSLSLNAG